MMTLHLNKTKLLEDEEIQSLREQLVKTPETLIAFNELLERVSAIANGQLWDVLMSSLSVKQPEQPEQPAPICQNCGTPAQVGWHEVRTAVDDVVCHTDADGSQEIEY